MLLCANRHRSNKLTWRVRSCVGGFGCGLGRLRSRVVAVVRGFGCGRGRVRPDSVVGTAVVDSCALTCCGWLALRAGSLQMGAGMSDYMSAGRDCRVACVHIARF